MSMYIHVAMNKTNICVQMKFIFRSWILMKLCPWSQHQLLPQPLENWSGCPYVTLICQALPPSEHLDVHIRNAYSLCRISCPYTKTKGVIQACCCKVAEKKVSKVRSGQGSAT